MSSSSRILRPRSRTPDPLIDIVEPDVDDNDNDNDDDDDDDDNDKGAVLRGGGEMTNEWDFEEVARRRRATEDDLTAWEEGGGMANLQRCCFVLWLESYCILHRNKIQHVSTIRYAEEVLTKNAYVRRPMLAADENFFSCFFCFVVCRLCTSKR